MPDTPRVEILLVRDPDGGTDLTVWIDGVRAGDEDYLEFVVDAGRGYTWDDWVEQATYDAAQAGSAEVKAAVLAAYADPPGLQYIDGWPENRHGGYLRNPELAVADGEAADER